MLKIKIITIISVLMLTGCSIKQSVNPVDAAGYDSICFVEDSSVRQEFGNAYKRALSEKGFYVQVVSSGTRYSSCPLLTTYYARWSWDVALYLSFAELKVYRDGTLIGDATYDSRRGAGRLDKFIDAENKLRELVNQLFVNVHAAAPMAIKSVSVANQPADINQHKPSKEQRLEELSNRKDLPYDEYQRLRKQISQEP